MQGHRLGNVERTISIVSLMTAAFRWNGCAIWSAIAQMRATRRIARVRDGQEVDDDDVDSDQNDQTTHLTITDWLAEEIDWWQQPEECHREEGRLSTVENG